MDPKVGSGNDDVREQCKVVFGTHHPTRHQRCPWVDCLGRRSYCAIFLGKVPYMARIRDRLGWDHKKSFFSWQQIVCTISSRKTYRRIDFIYINYFYHFSVTILYIPFFGMICSQLLAQKSCGRTLSRSNPPARVKVSQLHTLSYPPVYCSMFRHVGLPLQYMATSFVFTSSVLYIRLIHQSLHPAYPLCSLYKYVMIVIYMSSTFINILCPCLGMECAVNSSSPQSDTIPLQRLIYMRDFALCGKHTKHTPNM